MQPPSHDEPPEPPSGKPHDAGIGAVVVSCEHAGARVPPALAAAFGSPAAQRALGTHRGWDLGALPVAEAMAVALGAPLYATLTSRLVVDCNRSPDHPRVRSRWLSHLTPTEHEALIARLHAPHRTAVAAAVDAAIAEHGAVLHIAVHSFTPRWHGRQRPTQVGLLYDPKRPSEHALCLAWQARLQATTGWVVHRNRPYRGDTDGLCTTLRQTRPAERYVGIELECNQGWLAERPPAAVAAALCATVATEVSP